MDTDPFPMGVYWDAGMCPPPPTHTLPTLGGGAAASFPRPSSRQGALWGGAARGAGGAGASRRPKMAQPVPAGELPLPQLELLKGQLDQEVEFLSSSIAQLKVVQTKYVEAKDCLNVLNKSNEGKDLLVPLTSSMYVPGKLSDVERVLIDIGTGYYVEKSADDARDFFKRKIDFLTKQMEKIQPALQEKHAMKQAVVEVMSQKIQQLTALGAAQGATTKA
ncbi:prefoldin subunit 5 [Strigops habroptila]|nr:prefoldin subunit 5 [Strigops habroptila]